VKVDICKMFLIAFNSVKFLGILVKRNSVVIVLYPKKGVCADPVDEGAILGEGGGEPHSSDKGRQLALDTGRGKT
jgi:hypothetical protein